MRQQIFATAYKHYLEQRNHHTEAPITTGMIKLFFDNSEEQPAEDTDNPFEKSVFIKDKRFIVDTRPTTLSQNSDYILNAHAFDNSNNQTKIIVLWGNFYTQGTPTLFTQSDTLKPLLSEKFSEKCSNAILGYTSNHMQNPTSPHCIAVSVNTYHLTLAAYLSEITYTAKTVESLRLVQRHIQALIGHLSSLLLNEKGLTPNDIFVQLKDPKTLLEENQTLLSMAPNIASITVANKDTLAEVIKKDDDPRANIPFSENEDSLIHACNKHPLILAYQKACGKLETALKEKLSPVIYEESYTRDEITGFEKIYARQLKHQFFTQQENISRHDLQKHEYVTREEIKAQHAITRLIHDEASYRENVVTTQLSGRSQLMGDFTKTKPTEKQLTFEIQKAINARNQSRGTTHLFTTKLEHFEASFKEKVNGGNFHAAIALFAENISTFSDKSAQAFEDHRLIQIDRLSGRRILTERIASALHPAAQSSALASTAITY